MKIYFFQIIKIFFPIELNKLIKTLNPKFRIKDNLKCQFGYRIRIRREISDNLCLKSFFWYFFSSKSKIAFFGN